MYAKIRPIGLMLYFAISACTGSLKDAVHAYGLAAEGAAQAGAALVVECSSTTQEEPKRQESCAKAQKTFEVIVQSAQRLQMIN